MLITCAEWLAANPWAKRCAFHPDVRYEVPRMCWGPGDWNQEPDVVLWETSGLPAMIVRSYVAGSLNGYVGVPPGHPYHGLSYSQLDLQLLAHGGLSFAEPAYEAMELALEGEWPGSWWFGFDCAHAFDVAPAMEALLLQLRGGRARPRLVDIVLPEGMDLMGYRSRYWSVEAIRHEIEDLAEQLAGATNEGVQAMLARVRADDYEEALVPEELKRVDS